MGLSVDHPALLLLLLAVPLVVGLGRRGLHRVATRQHRVATWLRATAVALLVLALAGVRLSSSGGAVDVAFLVDASDSVGGDTAAAVDWIRAALLERGGDDRAAVGVFGRDARLEQSLREDPVIQELATVVDGRATDISRALRLGQGVLGSEHRRRVVLLTDGRSTTGDPVATADALAAGGVAVDVVVIGAGRTADLLVEEVRAPSRVREGEAYEVVAVVANTGDETVEATLTVSADGTEVHRGTVRAAPGRTEVVVPATATAQGTVRYEVRASSGASTVPENDTGRAAVQVAGPPRVLVVEGSPGAGEELHLALESAGIPVDRRTTDTSGVPTLDALLGYESTVLVDVPAEVVGTQGMAALDAYVRDAGKGLVAVGGDNSFGMGGYDGTTLEELLPVFARVRNPERRPSVAEALVVDVSGSMAACHCRPDGFAGGPGPGQEGGVDKTDISREAIARAVGALEQQDLVGVLAFSAVGEWVLPLQEVPPQALVDEALARLHPDGPTNVAPAIRQAIEGLKDANARLRHIVLFTDGFSEDPEMLAVAREAAEAGITLSVVATGEGTGDVLERMADIGGGRYYPGRDLFSIPDIIVSEVRFAARPTINEGSFLPVVSGLGPPTRDLTEAPPLHGYLATTAKPTARTLLQVGEERDPLLASWQAGLGTAVAWTSDTSPRWSARWVTWDRFSRFWADVVRSTFPGDPEPGFSLQATATTDGVRITVASADTLPGDVTATATVTDPDGRRHDIDLDRTDLRTWETEVGADGQGVHAVSATLTRAGADLFHDATTATRSYPPEYAAAGADPGLIERLATAGDGRVDPDPAAVFDPGGLAPGESSTPLAGLLLLLALMILPADVGLRRLRLEREDLSRVRRWLRRHLTRREVAERSRTSEGLMDAKRRARERLERD